MLAKNYVFLELTQFLETIIYKSFTHTHQKNNYPLVDPT